MLDSTPRCWENWLIFYIDNGPVWGGALSWWAPSQHADSLHTSYQSPMPRPHVTMSGRPRPQPADMCKIYTSLKQPYNVGNIFSDNIHVHWSCVRSIYIWLSNKLFCKIYIRDILNYLNSRCNTAKLLWVVIYVVCYDWFSPDLVVMNICR